MGGVRMANALGLHVNVYHMNEGHAALLTLALLESEMGGGPLGAPPKPTCCRCATSACSRRTRRFPPDTIASRPSRPFAFSAASGPRAWRSLDCFHDGLLNMTLLALRFSRYANGVAMQHGKVSREMFPEYHDRLDHQRSARADLDFGAGAADARRAHLPSWRRDNLYLRNAIDLPEQAILTAHARAKEELLTEVASRTGLVLESACADAGICAPRGDLQARQPACSPIPSGC